MARRPKDSDRVIIEGHLESVNSMLDQLDNYIKSYNLKKKLTKDFSIQNFAELDKAMELHIKYTTEMLRITGYIAYVEEQKAQEKKLREGSTQSTLVEFLSNESSMVEALQELFEKMGMELPDSIFTKKEEPVKNRKEKR